MDLEQIKENAGHGLCFAAWSQTAACGTRKTVVLVLLAPVPSTRLTPARATGPYRLPVEEYSPSHAFLLTVRVMNLSILSWF